jgi:hypothetical protein
MCLNVFFIVLKMADNVERERLGRQSVAHCLACIERTPEMW